MQNVFIFFALDECMLSTDQSALLDLSIIQGDVVAGLPPDGHDTAVQLPALPARDELQAGRQNLLVRGGLAARILADPTHLAVNARLVRRQARTGADGYFDPPAEIVLPVTLAVVGDL